MTGPVCLADDVEGLVRCRERPLHQVVVVRGHEEQLRSIVRAEQRQPREEPVQRAQWIVGVEDSGR